MLLERACGMSDVQRLRTRSDTVAVLDFKPMVNSSKLEALKL